MVDTRFIVDAQWGVRCLCFDCFSGSRDTSLGSVK